MRIATLPPLPADKTVYVVGTGPSLRVTPYTFLHDKFTIGLNQAWKYMPVTLGLTVHPDLMVEQRASALPTDMQWVVKRNKPPLVDVELDDPRFYCFDTSYDIATVHDQPADVLYLGEGVQTTAMDLAARMGAKYIVLVGCDARALGGDFHGHDQHVRWLGVRPDDQFRAYRDTTAAVRAVLRKKGIGVMSLTPFIGIDAGEEDYARLKKEMNLKALPRPKDVSPYKRDPRTIRTATTPAVPPPLGMKKVKKIKPELRHAPKPPPRKRG